MVRMLSGVVNSAKTASRRVCCGALSLGTLPGHTGTGWVTRHGLGAPVQAGQQFGGSFGRHAALAFFIL